MTRNTKSVIRWHLPLYLKTILFLPLQVTDNLPSKSKLIGKWQQASEVVYKVIVADSDADDTQKQMQLDML